MSKLMRFSSLLGVGVAVSLIVAACGGGTATAVPTAVPTKAPAATNTTAPAPTATAVLTSSGEMNVALANMNFELIMRDGTMRSYIDSMYDWVIGSTPDGKMDPASGLATSWTVAPDALSLTLKTRDGITFWNGNKASASDIRANLERVVATGFPGTGGAGTKSAGYIGSEVPDANTVVVKFGKPSLYFHINQFSRLAGGSEPSHVIDGKYFAEVGEAGYNKAPSGSGPYKFKSVTIGDNVTVEAVTRHWLRGVPRTKTLTFKQVPEGSTRLALLRSGGADLALIGRAQLEDVKKAGLQIFARDNSGCGCWRIDEQYKAEYPNYGPNPLADARVRQALDWYAIDRKAIVDTFMKGLATPSMNYPVFSRDPAYKALPVPAYDPAKAKALLDAAGFPQKTGGRFELDFVIVPRPQIPEGQEIAESMAVYFEQLGIKVNRRPMEYANYRDTLTTGKGFTKPTVFGVWFLAGSPVAGAGISGVNWRKGGSLFATAWDEDVAKVADLWGQAKTQDDYIKLGQQYQQILYDKGLTSILFSTGEIIAASAKVPKAYNLGTAGYSFQFEVAAAMR